MRFGPLTSRSLPNASECSPAGEDIGRAAEGSQQAFQNTKVIEHNTDSWLIDWSVPPFRSLSRLVWPDLGNMETNQTTASSRANTKRSSWFPNKASAIDRCKKPVDRYIAFKIMVAATTNGGPGYGRYAFSREDLAIGQQHHPRHSAEVRVHSGSFTGYDATLRTNDKLRGRRVEPSDITHRFASIMRSVRL